MPTRIVFHREIILRLILISVRQMHLRMLFFGESLIFIQPHYAFPSVQLLMLVINKHCYSVTHSCFCCKYPPQNSFKSLETPRSQQNSWEICKSLHFSGFEHASSIQTDQDIFQQKEQIKIRYAECILLSETAITAFPRYNLPHHYIAQEIDKNICKSC